jgi:hypothetical protein
MNSASCVLGRTGTPKSSTLRTVILVRRQTNPQISKRLVPSFCSVWLQSGPRGSYEIDSGGAGVKEGMLDGTGGPSRRRRGHFSAATRARMAAAQRARWSRVRGTRTTSAKAPIPIRAKRRLSAAGLAGIRAAQKTRWAKWKQRQKNVA